MPGKRTVHYVLGYVAAGLLVLGLMPGGLWLASAAFDHLTGTQLIPDAGLRVAVAAALALLGLPLGVWSVVVQNTIGQGGPAEIAGIEVTPKTQSLVVTGPYKYTRNPMLLGACVFYYGLAILLDSVAAVALVTLFMAIMLAEVKLIEEPRLLKDFGDEYDEYRRRVSMFVPWRPRQPRS